MNKPRKVWRWIVGTVLVLLILLLIVFLSLPYFLASPWAAEQVKAQLQELYGGQVDVDQVEIGLHGGSTISGLQFYEEGEDKDKVLLQVDRVTTDVDAGQILAGHSVPGRLTLDGAKLMLRWDRKGQLLTHLPEKKIPTGPLPEKIPAMALKNSRLVLMQDGQREATIVGIDGSFEKKDDQYILRGKAWDDSWGNLVLDGTLVPAEQLFKIEIKSEGPIHFTTQRLQSLPFVPDRIGEELQVEGKAWLKIVLTANLEDGSLQYRAELEPAESSFAMPNIELKTSGIHGKIIITDGKAYIEELQGQALGGTVHVAGSVDFRTPEVRVNLPGIKVEDVPVQNIPKSWNFPLRGLPGDLNGEANVTATFREEVEIEGEVTGNIEGKPDEPRTEFNLKVETNARGIIWRQTPDDQKPDEMDETTDEPEIEDEIKIEDEPTAGSVIANPAFLVPMVLTVADFSLLKDQFSFCALQADQPPEPPQQPEPPPGISLSLKMENVDLEKYAEKVGLDLPFALKGKLSFQVKATIPTDAFADIQQYSAAGTLQVEQLQIADFRFKSLTARAVYEEGILKLEELDGQLLDEAGKKAGSLHGTARMELFPLGELNLDVAIKEIDVEPLTGLAQAEAALGGLLSGTANATVAVEKLQDIKAWSGKGKLHSKQLKGFGLMLQEGLMDFNLKQGVFAITALKGSLENMPVTGTGQVTLFGNFPFQTELKLTQGQLQILERLPEDLRPPVTLAGKVDGTLEARGTLEPLEWELTGTIQAQQVKAYNLTLARAGFAWSIDGESLKVTNFKGELYDGKVSGQAVFPLQPDKEGSISLAVKELDAGLLAQDAQLPFPVKGEIDGNVKAKIAAEDLQKQRDITADLDLAAPTLQVQGIPVDKMTGKFQVEKDQVDYKIQGKVLDGTMELEGKMPLQKKPQVPPGQGTLRLKNVNIAQFWRTVPAGPPVTGILNATLNFTHDPKTLVPAGSGTMTITNLHAGPHKLSPTLKANLVLDSRFLRLTNIQGTFADGSLQGQVALDLERPQLSKFSLKVNRAELAKTPGLAEISEGPANISLNGTLGANVWFGGGALYLPRGKVYGLDVTDLRLPYHWRYFLAAGNNIINVPQGYAQLGQGHISGRIGVEFGRVFNLDFKANFTNVDLKTVLGPTLTFGGLGQARVNGNIELGGYNIRTANDLKGLLNADFNHTQALTLPILRQVASTLNLSPSTQFTRGKFRSLIFNGAYHVQELSLDSQALKIFAEGQITFQMGLSLDVVIQTGQNGVFEQSRLRGLANRIPFAGPVPVGLILQTTQAMKNRVVYLQVTGTVNNPVVRVLPLRTLSQNAARFFLEQFLPFPVGPMGSKFPG